MHQLDCSPTDHLFIAAFVTMNIVTACCQAVRNPDLIPDWPRSLHHWRLEVCTQL